MPRVRILFNRRTFAVAVLLSLALYATCYWLTESQWFQAIGYAQVWRARCLAQFQIVLLSLLVFGGGMLGSVYLAARPFAQTVALPPAYRTFERRLNRARQLALRVAYGVSLTLPLLLAKVLCSCWQEWLLLRSGWSMPVPQPWSQYADSFSLYALPFLRPLTGAFWIATVVASLLVAVLVAPRAFYQLLARDRTSDAVSWWHCVLLGAVLFTVRAFGYSLQRIESRLSSLHEFSLSKAFLLGGEVTCGGIALIFLGLCLALRFSPKALKTVHWTFRKTLLATLVSLSALFVPSLLAGAVALPGGRPSVSMEAENSNSPQRAAARLAWGLAEVEVAPSVQAKPPLPGKAPPVVPLWSETELLRARSTKNWPSLKMIAPQRGVRDVTGTAGLQTIATFETDTAGQRLPWPNRHLADVAGRTLGVAAYDPTRAVDGRPAVTELNAELDSRPLHYGANPQAWLLTDKSEGGVVDLSAFWRRAVWAVRFRDINLLLAEPRYRYLLWRRSTAERLAAVAPFLVPGGEPAAIAAGGKLLWMSDGLSVSRTFPGGPVAGSGALQGYNAAFDSVKMVMDASTGALELYAAYPEAKCDPLLLLWQRIFPGLIRPLQTMPDELRRQRRYPQALFEMQASLLAGWQNRQRAQQQESYASLNTASRTLNSSYALMAENGGISLVLQAPLISRDGSETEAQLIVDCAEDYGHLRVLRDVAGTPSPLAFTKSLDDSILARGSLGGASSLRLAPDERWVFGDVIVAPGRWGESWVPVFRASENETRLAAVVARRGTMRGVGTSVEEAYFDLLQQYEAPAAGKELSAEELVARASRLQAQAENAVRRGAMTEWSRLMAQQRATLLRLQGKLHTSKND